MREIHRILCPVDLSDVSRHTADHAVAVARRYAAAITALHVCYPVMIPAGDFAVVGPLAMPAEDEVKKARTQVEALFEAAGGGIVDVLIETGQPAPRILAAADSLPADLIVMGTHGVGGFEHLVLGSVTEKVLRRATCPVLTIPPRPQTTSKLPFKRIVCAVDFSESSLAALKFAVSLAQDGAAAVTILHVFEWAAEPLTTRPIAVPEYRLEIEREVASQLEDLVPAFARECRATTRLAHGKAYREILGVATEDSADLIVMGVQGRNALDVMLFGSTTNQVIRRATCPVLTLRG